MDHRRAWQARLFLFWESGFFPTNFAILGYRILGETKNPQIYKGDIEMSKRFSNVKNENEAYILEIDYLGENPDEPKLTTKAAIHLLEEALLDILPSPDEANMSINDIKERMELPGIGDSNNWAWYLIYTILNKLEEEGRAQPEVTVTEKGIERRIGWRLSKNEYERRLDDAEEYAGEIYGSS